MSTDAPITGPRWVPYALAAGGMAIGLTAPLGSAMLAYYAAFGRPEIGMKELAIAVLAGSAASLVVPLAFLSWRRPRLEAYGYAIGWLSGGVPAVGVFLWLAAILATGAPH